MPNGQEMKVVEKELWYKELEILGTGVRIHGEVNYNQGLFKAGKKVLY